MTVQVLPGLEGEGDWQVRHRGDSAAVALANRHYSRRNRQGRIVGGPWKTLVLLTHDEQALWITTWTNRPMDNLDAYRCSMFRNEGDQLSSDLIRSAMIVTEDMWGPVPKDGWVTWINRREVRSTNPGYCFAQADWEKDRTYDHPRLVRYRA